MWQEWLQVQLKEILEVLSKWGQFDFTLLPLFKNPLFDGCLAFLFLFSLIFRFYRILSLCLVGLGFLISWSFLIAPYGTPGAVPLVHWWYLVGITVFLIAVGIYLCLVRD
ncbi:MAG: hypothetical protein LWW94_00160 [Candidatus Desulfofervidaceae bacterium]|nr:hypothetical protein [Candidatus Desulfofervidaceae bacterium]